MMTGYFLSFLNAHKMKTALLVLSVAVYFSLAAVMLNVAESIPEIAALPFKRIGVETIVQKSGRIPEHMTGAIFPHSNGPIYDDEVRALTSLGFAADSDVALFAWYFDSSFFKSFMGVDVNGHIFPALLERNLERGKLDLDARHVVVTGNFAEAHRLSLGDAVDFGGRKFFISGVVRPSPSGNIIPADMYMTLDAARDISYGSKEMRRVYRFPSDRFVNVVAVRSDPRFRGDKVKAIQALNKDYLVFSEKTFSRDIENQISLLSSFGRIMFFILGFVIVILFGLLTFYNVKTREPEIALLRVIGWPMGKLKRQFIAESLALLLAGLLFGNLFALAGLLLVGGQTVTMQLPWEFSARPHFLPQENAIARSVTAFIPVHFDWLVFTGLTLAFLLVFGIIILLLFTRINRVKPLKYLS